MVRSSDVPTTRLRLRGPTSFARASSRTARSRPSWWRACAGAFHHRVGWTCSTTPVGPGRRAEVTFLAPLDPLVWDRDLPRSVFDFDYLWEVYTPEHKRKVGLLRAADPVRGPVRIASSPASTASGVLRILGLWWEDGFDPGWPRASWRRCAGRWQPTCASVASGRIEWAPHLRRSPPHRDQASRLDPAAGPRWLHRRGISVSWNELPRRDNRDWSGGSWPVRAPAAAPAGPQPVPASRPRIMAGPARTQEALVEAPRTCHNPLPASRSSTWCKFPPPEGKAFGEGGPAGAAAASRRAAWPGGGGRGGDGPKEGGPRRRPGRGRRPGRPCPIASRKTSDEPRVVGIFDQRLVAPGDRVPRRRPARGRPAGASLALGAPMSSDIKRMLEGSTLARPPAT
ncbi:MAG: crosslink repair DNA glycosylase YcaQ family protein [Chloroflexota bacterium]